MIYDCFTFFNELELLELRLHELDSVVDRFVIVEANRTHSNKPKPLYFEENKARFERFLPKIIHIIVTDFPAIVKDRWVLEKYQRNAIARGLESCQPNDVVIISDVDEIVRPAAIVENMNKPGVKFFCQRLYYYYFNCVCPCFIWNKAKMVFYRDLRNPQWLREYPHPEHSSKYRRSIEKYGHYLRQICGQKDIYIDNAGWHFSYLGGVEQIKTKLQSFAHSEYDKDEFLETENLLRAVEQGKDLLKRDGMQFEFVPVDSSFPNYLVKNYNNFSLMIRSMD